MTHQERIIKVEINKGTLQKKKGHVKTTAKSSGKSQNRSPKMIPYVDYGAMMGKPILSLNFIKAVEEKKRSSWAECLDRVTSSYAIARHASRNNLFNFMGNAEAQPSKPEPNPSLWGALSKENKYLGDSGVLEKFKLLQPKKEDLFKEISMGFRLTINPVSGHVFIEMNVTPSDKVNGFILPL